MEQASSYPLELLGQVYRVRSSDDAAVVAQVFARLSEEVSAVGDSHDAITSREQLVIAALNITQRLLDLEEENKLLLELLNAE